MAKPVTHLSNVRMIGPDSRITGTLCNRMSNSSDDLNVADTDDQVTCKFCLRQMAYRKRKAVA